MKDSSYDEGIIFRFILDLHTHGSRGDNNHNDPFSNQRHPSYERGLMITIVSGIGKFNLISLVVRRRVTVKGLRYRVHNCDRLIFI